uniref:Pyridoxamine 5'-phosphate oxidase family protein n=1 Tax=Bellilinea caldifistulae TaxID=360411 RepID=A0A7C4Q4L6_9CHLR
MFRTMRRSRQALTPQEMAAVLERRTNGVLACLGDEGYPYAVPLSFVFFNGKIYFHSAKVGHKVEAITKYPKVSFAVIDEDRVLSEKFTTCFRSVIAFGKARIVEGNEYRQALAALVEKYAADQPEEAKRNEINQCAQAVIIGIEIEHMTGKQAVEYVNDGTE